MGKALAKFFSICSLVKIENMFSAVKVKLWDRYRIPVLAIPVQKEGE